MIMQDNDLRDLTVDLTMIDWPMQSMQQCWHRTKTATHITGEEFENLTAKIRNEASVDNKRALVERPSNIFIQTDVWPKCLQVP